MVLKKLWLAIPSLVAIGLSSAEAGNHHLWGAGYCDFVRAFVRQWAVNWPVAVRLPHRLVSPSMKLSNGR